MESCWDTVERLLEWQGSGLQGSGSSATLTLVSEAVTANMDATDFAPPEPMLLALISREVSLVSLLFCTASQIELMPSAPSRFE